MLSSNRVVKTEPYRADTMNHSIYKSIAITAGLILAVALYVFADYMRPENPLPENVQAVAVSPAQDLQGFSLYDHNEQPIDLTTLKGQWTFISFGFTHCPDVCPATLSQLALLNRSLQSLPAGLSPPHFMFVSVDPKRDTPSHLGAYVTYFDASFTGASGTPEALSAFEKQLGAFHRFINEGSEGNYTVEHSADIFLIDPRGRLVAKFRPPMNIKQVAGQYVDLLGVYRAYEI